MLIATVPFSDRRSFLFFYVLAEERLSFAEESGDDGHKDERRDDGSNDIGERLGIEHRRCAKANRQKDCQRDVDAFAEERERQRGANEAHSGQTVNERILYGKRYDGERVDVDKVHRHRPVSGILCK